MGIAFCQDSQLTVDSIQLLLFYLLVRNQRQISIWY